MMKFKKKQVLLNGVAISLNKVTRVDGIFEAVYKVDSGFICLNRRYAKSLFFVDGASDMEVGGIYFFINNYPENPLIKINDELLDDKKMEEFFGKMDEWANNGGSIRHYGRYLVQKSELDKGEINFEIIMKCFEDHKSKVIAKEKEDKLSEEERIKEQEKEIISEKEKYDTTGGLIFRGISISGNIIVHNIYSYILNKNINKIFSYEEIKQVSYNGETILSHIEIF